MLLYVSHLDKDMNVQENDISTSEKLFSLPVIKIVNSLTNGISNKKKFSGSLAKFTFGMDICGKT